MQVHTWLSDISFHLQQSWLQTLVPINQNPCQRLFSSFLTLSRDWAPSEVAVLRWSIFSSSILVSWRLGRERGTQSSKSACGAKSKNFEFKMLFLQMHPIHWDFSWVSHEVICASISLLFKIVWSGPRPTISPYVWGGQMSGNWFRQK